MYGMLISGFAKLETTPVDAMLADSIGLSGVPTYQAAKGMNANARIFPMCGKG